MKMMIKKIKSMLTKEKAWLYIYILIKILSYVYTIFVPNDELYYEGKFDFQQQVDELLLRVCVCVYLIRISGDIEWMKILPRGERKNEQN